MTLKKHLTLFLITFLAWLGFYLLGLPSHYYTDWTLTELILLCLVTFFAMVPLIGALTLIFMGGDIFRASLWLAFYASVPLFVYDFIMVGVIGGAGWRFLFSHWYLSLGYVIVWLEAPLIGLALQKLIALPVVKAE
jgi:hypothetical protein